MIKLTAEFQLLNWNESASGGSKIIFAVSPEDMEQFKTLTRRDGKRPGQRLMAVLVPIGDDEKPLPDRKQKSSQLAYLLCKSPEFQLWANAKSFNSTVSDEESAKEFMCYAFGIASRGELDKNGIAEQLFDDMVREFEAYRGAAFAIKV